MVRKRALKHRPAKPFPKLQLQPRTASEESGALLTRGHGVSTFSVDVDTGSFDFGRAILQGNHRPSPRTIRTEEWINAFAYDYPPPAPTDAAPFRAHLALAPSPFADDDGRHRHVLRIGLQGRPVPDENHKPVHLVLLVDTSRSMNDEGRLRLAQTALHTLVDMLDDDDTVSLLRFSDDVDEVLAAAAVSDPFLIHDAIDALDTIGGTNLGSALQAAYRDAGKHLGPERMSRVMLFSDGDANVGLDDPESILQSIRGYVSEGITLSTFGIGHKGYNDVMLEQLADAGDGNFSYLSSPQQIHDLFVDELDALLTVIAKDVKVQVQFNPSWVKRHRLLGYENRKLQHDAFDDDATDAGDIGAGHAVTALYELEFQKPPRPTHAERFLEVRVRHKTPRQRRSQVQSFQLSAQDVKSTFAEVDDDTRWAASVALAAEVLAETPFAEGKTLADARAIGEAAARGRFADERLAFLPLLDVEPRRVRLVVPAHVTSSKKLNARGKRVVAPPPDAPPGWVSRNDMFARVWAASFEFRECPWPEKPRDVEVETTFYVKEGVASDVELSSNAWMPTAFEVCMHQALHKMKWQGHTGESERHTFALLPYLK